MKVNVLFCLAIIILISSILSCSKDDGNKPKDKVEIITLYVSAKTGSYQPWGSDEPQECMLIREEGKTEYSTLHFSGIVGFEYEKEWDYTLSVEKITLANPPVNGLPHYYKLIEVIWAQWNPDPIEPVFLSEDVLEFKEGCPYSIYDILNPELYVTSEGRISDPKDERYSYENGWIYLDYVVIPQNTYYNNPDYMAKYVFVVDPLIDTNFDCNLRGAYIADAGLAIKDVLNEEGLAFLKTAAVGTKLTYRLIFMNNGARVLQKIEVTFIRK